MTKKGMFVVFEGIDGSGKSTQIGLLADYIRKLDKYNEILLAREPTRDAVEMIQRLKSDDAYSGAEDDAVHFIKDRSNHALGPIGTCLDDGIHVISDRYSMSTCAYQWTQGVDLYKLIRMHKAPFMGIISPTLTFFLDVSVDNAKIRRGKRGEKVEKYESSKKFQDELSVNYKMLASNLWKESHLFGDVVTLDGNASPEIVHAEVCSKILPYYEAWQKS